MTSSNIDISNLTEQQQVALQQLTSVTNQEVEAALPLLRQCQWNAQIAITRFFDGDTEIVDLAAEAARQAPPVVERQAINLQDSFNSRNRDRHRATGTQSAPRVVAIPDNQFITQPSYLISLCLFPISLTFNLVRHVSGFLAEVFPFLSRTYRTLSPDTSPNDQQISLDRMNAVARFIEHFESKYKVDSGVIPFQQCSYSQAYDTAKKDLKYLLVVLLSFEHDDTASFVQDTLLSTTFKSFVNDHTHDLLVWGGNLRESEAYQVATALNVSKLPYIGLIVYATSTSPFSPATSASMSIVMSSSGLISSQKLVTGLETTMKMFDNQLIVLRAEQREQKMSREIVQEQDSAYQRSLTLDRERARKKREEESAKDREKEAEKRRIDEEERRATDVVNWKKWRAARLSQEPIASEESVRISVRLLDGRRVIRKFHTEATIEELYAWVECLDIDVSGINEKTIEAPKGYEHQYEFVLVSPMPREVYDIDTGGKVCDRIGRNGNLITESL